MCQWNRFIEQTCSGKMIQSWIIQHSKRREQTVHSWIGSILVVGDYENAPEASGIWKRFRKTSGFQEYPYLVVAFDVQQARNGHTPTLCLIAIVIWTTTAGLRFSFTRSVDIQPQFDTCIAARKTLKLKEIHPSRFCREHASGLVERAVIFFPLSHFTVSYESSRYIRVFRSSEDRNAGRTSSCCLKANDVMHSSTESKELRLHLPFAVSSTC